VAVGFWTLDCPPKAMAVMADDGRTITYGELRDRADRFAESIGAPASASIPAPSSAAAKTLGFVLCRNTPECLIAYLGALRSGHATCLLDADLQRQQLDRLIDTYAPEWIFALEEPGFRGYAQQQLEGGYLSHRSTERSHLPVAAELALLLPTSGSTGSPKLVRLAYRNLQANACAITDFLRIGPEDRCITSLPMAYSYGLSVLHTHLLAGASVLMTTSSFLQRDFWTFFRAQRPTSLAGVPYHYDVLLRMKLLEQDLPGLRTLTQAGGRLSPESIARVAAIAAERDWRFFVMYGQTEATARISYVPAERLHEKIGSVGIPIRGGRLSIESTTQELAYAGPNVMLGYAETRADLGKGDELGGRLSTGDLATCDADGYYFIVGRLKRFLKIFGKRFSLDDMEGLISRQIGQAVACLGADDRVCIAIDTSTSEEAVAKVLKGALNLHPSAFRIAKVDSLPRLANGKLDYQSLGRSAGV
jgi:long-chain acyl-CoA synthetase